MAYKESKKRGKSAVSGLVGGTSVVAGQTRRGSAGGPVKRKKSKAKAADSGKIKETTREQRDRARGDYNVRVAADPSNPARLRPSERTPNKADIEKKKAYFDRLRGDKMKAVKKRMGQKSKRPALVPLPKSKEKYPVINNPYKVTDEEMGREKWYVRDTSKPYDRREVPAPRKAKKKKD